MLDFFIFIFLVIFIILGFLRGFRKELGSLVNIFLFISVSYFYADFVGNYIINFLNYDLSNFPKYSYLVIGCIFIFLLTKFFIYLLSKVLFSSSELVRSLFFDKFFGLFFGFIKGFTLLSILFSLMINYDVFYLITDFDNNSLFLDYFLQFGVQLQYVWNHWYS